MHIIDNSRKDLNISILLAEKNWEDANIREKFLI